MYRLHCHFRTRVFALPGVRQKVHPHLALHRGPQLWQLCDPRDQALYVGVYLSGWSRPPLCTRRLCCPSCRLASHPPAPLVLLPLCVQSSTSTWARLPSCCSSLAERRWRQPAPRGVAGLWRYLGVTGEGGGGTHAPPHRQPLASSRTRPRPPVAFRTSWCSDTALLCV